MKMIIDFIVTFIVSRLKKLLFEFKKRKINKEIQQYKKELKNEVKNLKPDYDNLDKLYEQYKRERKDRMRSSLRVLHGGRKETKKDDKN